MCGWQEEVFDRAWLILALERFDPEITDILSLLTLLCNFFLCFFFFVVVGSGVSFVCLFFVFKLLCFPNAMSFNQYGFKIYG